MKKSIISILFVILLLSGFKNLEAYILEAPHLLYLMTDSMGKPERLIVKGKLVLFNEQFSDGFVELNETVRYNFMDQFRSEIDTGDTQKIHISSGDKDLIIVDYKIASETEGLIEHYKDILLFRNQPLLQKRLYHLGIDIFITSIGRFNNRLVYIIGAEFNNESVPQLWIDKETLRPVRFILKNKTIGNFTESVEFRYYEWKIISKTWYPWRIEFYVDNILVRIVRVNHVKLNPVFKDNLFSIKYHRDKYFFDKDEENNSKSESQYTIDRFNKRISPEE